MLERRGGGIRSQDRSVLKPGVHRRHSCVHNALNPWLINTRSQYSLLFQRENCLRKEARRRHLARKRGHGGLYVPGLSENRYQHSSVFHTRYGVKIFLLQAPKNMMRTDAGEWCVLKRSERYYWRAKYGGRR